MGNFKKSILKFKSEFLKDKLGLLGIILFIVYSGATFELFNRPFGHVSNIKIPFDDMIPMIKELIIVYHTFAPMMIVVGFVLFTMDKENYKKYVIALFLSQSLAYLIYIFFQTYVPRYDTALLGDDIFSNIIKITYQIDNSYSGAPSLHVANMFISIFYYNKLNLSKKNKFFMTAYLLIIAMTTVLVKQHVFLDIPTGIVFAIFVYYLVEYICRKKRA